MTETAVTEQDAIECRRVQIRLLDALKTICDKHKLVFWIDFGSLLGAVRHKGFIPWDDDIDLSMPMADYKKFLEIAEKELPRDIFLQTSKTDKNFKQTIAKLRDCYSTFLEHSESDDDLIHHGIYIDIFPSVYYPPMPYLLRKTLLYFTVRSRARAFNTGEHVIWNFLVYVACKFVWALFWPFKTNKVGPTVEDNGYYHVIPDTYIYPLKDIEFEGKMYPAPHNTHEYLTLMYGPNYITPPPIDKRVPHAKLILPHRPSKHPRAIQPDHATAQ